ncbi:MAG: hypothetical protein AB8B73_10000 [Ekhidna sp.]
MNYLSLENEILSSVQNLNGHQKNAVLEYIQNIKEARHSKKMHRRVAMQQIQEALVRL